MCAVGVAVALPLAILSGGSTPRSQERIPGGSPTVNIVRPYQTSQGLWVTGHGFRTVSRTRKSLTVAQVKAAFARQHINLRGPTKQTSAPLLFASNLPTGASLAVVVKGSTLVYFQWSRFIGGHARWPVRERNVSNVSVVYDLPPALVSRAETAIRRLRLLS
jgi:hypothetical protein